MKKIRIAYLTKDLSVNGISSVIMNYGKNIDKTKFEITIFSGNPIVDQYKKICEEQHIEIIVTPAKDIKNPLKYYSFLMKNINRKKYDIVHIHGNSATITIELLIALIKGVKVRIAHSHNTTCNHSKIHKILKPLLQIICTNRLACGIEAGEWMFKKGTFEVINNAIDVQKFLFNEECRKKYRKKYNLDDKIVIGHVGVFNYQKNHEYLIRIFERLCKEDNKYYLVLIGEGEKYNEIKQMVKKKKIDNNILFVGRTSQVNEWLNAMDIMLMPSRFEGLPLALIEWQANALPCLVSNKVTSAAKITNLVEFLPLENNEDAWCTKIKSTKIKNRKSDTEYVKSKLELAGYDIEKNIHFLEKEYEETVNGKIGG